MKPLSYALAIAALSLCCVQTVSAKKQPVRASKKDPLDTRDVTVKIIGSKGPKKPISSSTFKTDTSGVLTGKLSFDFLNGIRDRGEDGPINTIRAVYIDKPTEEFSISVSQKDVPKGSEIKIGSNTIEIDTSKVKNKQPEPRAPSRVATVQIPKGSGQWRIVTGNNDLRKERAIVFAKDVSLSAGGQDDINERLNRVYAGYPEVLDDISCSQSNCQVLIYENKPTRIYAQQEGKDGYVTLLKQTDIKKAGQSSIIIIDNDGKARITNELLLGLEPEKIVVQQESDQDQQFMNYATQGLPYQVALKALLLSKNDDDYVQKRNSLLRPIRGSLLQAIDDVKVKELMDEKLEPNLGPTPYVKAKLSFNWDRQGTVAQLHDAYKRIYHYLSNGYATFWKSSYNKNKAGSLFRAIWNL